MTGSSVTAINPSSTIPLVILRLKIPCFVDELAVGGADAEECRVRRLFTAAPEALQKSKSGFCSSGGYI
jgi:hypothetical protein